MKERPTAIFALSNTIAIGLHQSVARRKSEYSRTHLAHHVRRSPVPRLPRDASYTVSPQPTREICRIAIKYLLFFMLENQEIKSSPGIAKAGIDV